MSLLPIVSVSMITYGHEKFIEQAINCVLMQECNFEFELILVNDASPDTTDEVVTRMIETHPKAKYITYIKHEKNIGMMPNFIFALEKCRGNYIALCEGDDYWADPLKLQKQVDFLEANPDFVIHSGVAKILKQDNLSDEYIGCEKEDKVYTIENFYQQNNLVSCTVMFKNCIKSFPAGFKDIKFGDWYLYVLLLKVSKLKAYRSKDISSVYRIHATGVMSMLTLHENYTAHINLILKLKKIVGYKGFPKEVVATLNWYSFEKFKIEIQQQQYFLSIQTFLHNFYLIKFNTPTKDYISFLKNSITNK